MIFCSPPMKLSILADKHEKAAIWICSLCNLARSDSIETCRNRKVKQTFLRTLLWHMQPWKRLGSKWSFQINRKPLRLSVQAWTQCWKDYWPFTTKPVRVSDLVDNATCFYAFGGRVSILSLAQIQKLRDRSHLVCSAPSEPVLGKRATRPCPFEQLCFGSSCIMPTAIVKRFLDSRHFTDYHSHASQIVLSIQFICLRVGWAKVNAWNRGYCNCPDKVPIPTPATLVMEKSFWSFFSTLTMRRFEFSMQQGSCKADKSECMDQALTAVQCAAKWYLPAERTCFQYPK